MLIKEILAKQIFASLMKQMNNPKPSPAAQLELANELATWIDMYIRSATIIIPPGQTSIGQNSPGQLVVGASPMGPVNGATTTPGQVSAVTSAPSPPALIS